MRQGYLPPTTACRYPERPAIIGKTVTFRILGIPLRVRFSFVIVILLLGMPLVRSISYDPVQMLARLGIWWVVAVASVILHELGHALLARRFGATVSMELWALGGLTSWQPGGREITPARRAAIAAAGSGLGLVVGAATYPLWRMAGPGTGLIHLSLGWMVWVNLGWGLINWLPIRLLDGGHILRALIDIIWPKRAERIATLFFLGASAAIAVVAFRIGFPIISLFALVMLIVEIRQTLNLRSKGPRRRPAMSQPPEHFLLSGPISDPEGSGKT